MIMIIFNGVSRLFSCFVRLMTKKWLSEERERERETHTHTHTRTDIWRELIAQKDTDLKSLVKEENKKSGKKLYSSGLVVGAPRYPPTTFLILSISLGLERGWRTEMSLQVIMICFFLQICVPFCCPCVGAHGFSKKRRIIILHSGAGAGAAPEMK